MCWVDPRVVLGRDFSFLVGWLGRGSEKFPTSKTRYILCLQFVSNCMFCEFAVQCICSPVTECFCEIVCLKLSSLCPKVCCWLYGVRLGCGLGCFVVPKFSLAMGRVELG